MLTARDHNALVRRVRTWTRFASRLDRRLGGMLHADAAAMAVLAGLPGAALIEAPDLAVAADLLVLLDHLNLHAGTRLSVVPLGSFRYKVRGEDAGPGTGDRHAALRLTADVRAGGSAGYRHWPGRIDRVALITRDRPAALAAALDAYAGNLRRFGREYAEIVVYDESGPVGRHEVRSQVESMRAAGVAVRYFGPEEKHGLRAALETAVATGLPYPATERAAVLDALVGRLEVDGAWTGSAAAQRNWAIMSAAGHRVMVSDDDVRPAVLDAPLDALRAAARTAVAVDETGTSRKPGELLEGFLATTEVRAWSTDLLGLLDDTGARLASAVYTGHPDRRTALWLERFLEPGDESVDVLGTGIPLQRVRRGTSEPRARKFRGGAFASSGSWDGMEFAVRRGRNEDFSLALSALVTSEDRPQPAEEGGAHMLHLRGPRATGTFTAHREEREGNLVNAVVRAIGHAYAAARTGPFDPGNFRRFGHAVLDAELDRELTAEDLGHALFAEGLEYRRRARAHIRQLEDLAQALPNDLFEQWYADRAAPRAALLRAGAESLRVRGVPSDQVLMECAQVLVPHGLVSTPHLPALRHAWVELSDMERETAVRCLADEARYLAPAGLRSRAPQASPAALPRRIARKAEQTRHLIESIECDLGIPPKATAGSEPVTRAREEFRSALRHRARAEIWLFLAAMPYVPLVRAELRRLDRQGADGEASALAVAVAS